MKIDYKNPRMEESIQCMLVGVDFDMEVFILFPVDGDNYDTDNFQASIQHCELSRPDLKVT
jgi:hypothetical protein